jgi:hypothetical protein
MWNQSRTSLSVPGKPEDERKASAKMEEAPQILPRHELYCSDFGGGPADTCRGGRSRVERSMTKSDQFREYAEEALQWSRQSKTEEEKKTLLDLAITWTQAASLSEKKSVDPLRA